MTLVANLALAPLRQYTRPPLGALDNSERCEVRSHTYGYLQRHLTAPKFYWIAPRDQHTGKLPSHQEDYRHLARDLE